LTNLGKAGGKKAVSAAFKWNPEGKALIRLSFKQGKRGTSGKKKT